MNPARKFYVEHKDLCDNFHRHDELNFICFSDVFFGLCYIPKIQIHKSYRYPGQQMSSRYYIGIVNDRPAYIRVSNHWGVFHTSKGYDEELGDTVYESHRWELEGGKKKADGTYWHTSQAGYVYLDDYIER